MVESSVKPISRPVIDHLPVNINQIDEFACKQLDRVRSFPFVRCLSLFFSSHLIIDIVRALPPPPITYGVMRSHSPFSFPIAVISFFFVLRWLVKTPSPCSSMDLDIPPQASTSASSMAISTSTSASDHNQGRPKIKTKMLDGTAVNDKDGPDISISSTTTTTTTPPSLGQSKRGLSKPSWRGSEQGCTQLL